MIRGQLMRDRSRSSFKIAILIQPATSGRWRVCHWQSAGRRWSPPQTVDARHLEELPIDVTTHGRPAMIVAAARRSVVDGVVHWNVKTGTRHGKANVGGVRL